MSSECCRRCSKVWRNLSSNFIWSTTRSVKSKRNYDPKYIKYGFTSIEHKAKILLQCVVCLKTFCNVVMKPSLLKRHLERKHPNKMNAEESYFQRLADNVKCQRMDKTGQMQQKSPDVVAASFEIALLVAEQNNLILLQRLLFCLKLKFW